MFTPSLFLLEWPQPQHGSATTCHCLPLVGGTARMLQHLHPTEAWKSSLQARLILWSSMKTLSTIMLAFFRSQQHERSPVSLKDGVCTNFWDYKAIKNTHIAAKRTTSGSASQLLDEKFRFDNSVLTVGLAEKVTSIDSDEDFGIWISFHLFYFRFDLDD